MSARIGPAVFLDVTAAVAVVEIEETLMKPAATPPPRRRAVVGATAVSVVAAALYALPADANRPQELPVTVAVDSRLANAATVDGFAPTDARRPVGRIADDSGIGAAVLDELIVSVKSDSALRGFLDRHSGTVVDSFPAERGEPQTHLVRVTPPAQADAGTVARRLQDMGSQSGPVRVDSGRTLGLLGTLTEESGRDGVVDVSLNWVDESSAVADGTLYEDPKKGSNVFTWSYVSSTQPQQIGLDAAWQLLQANGKLTPKVKAMVSDGGFVKSVDLPSYTLREDKWGAHNRMKCTDGKGCPFHGTQVALTMAATHDNLKGAAGVAAPVIDDLVAVAVYQDTYKTLRKLEQHAKTYRPHVINMSWGARVTVAKQAYAHLNDRVYKRIAKRGALLVTSAGNEGANVDWREDVTVGGFPSKSPLWYPCESPHVLCVGALDVDKSNVGTTDRRPSSNWGDRLNSRSVEVYAPWLVHTVAEPGDPASVKRGNFTGTSAAAPFVSGVAALVKAANPSLTPAQVRKILLDTAHNGVGNAGDGIVPSSQVRRVNAAGAVAAALGVSLHAPKVSISKPTNNVAVTPGDPVSLSASATAFTGGKLPVRWSSSRDGLLFGGTTSTASRGVVLSPGVHVVTASATDIRGKTGTAKVTVRVVAKQPKVHIVSPGDGSSAPAGTPLVLHGASQRQDATYQPLEEHEVRWTVRRAGTLVPVFTGTGHSRTVPSSVMTPGAYTVRFEGTPDGGPTAVAEATVVITAVPAGSKPPTAVISRPTINASFLQFPSKPAPEVRLTGAAYDAQDGALSGRALQWVARSGNQQIVLCTGTNFPGAGSGGGIVALQDCGDVTVRLEPPASAPASNSWAIELRAVDSEGGVSAPATRVITVRHAPVG